MGVKRKPDRGGDAPPAGDLLPVLVGVTGKRRFDAADPNRDARLMAIFESRFRVLVQELDRRFPDTPKVLITGGAAGVDLRAAQVVLEEVTGYARRDRYPVHPLWSVVVMLALDLDLFEQDFQQADLRSDLRVLRELCARPDRVIVKRMRRLHLAPFDDSRPEALHPERVPIACLSRTSPHFDADERRRHLEQYGLWLARSACLLIAAGPPETAWAGAGQTRGLGGTARVVAYRRAGFADDAAAGVIQRSSELPADSPFEEDDGGYVLWIDPNSAAPAGSAIAEAALLRPRRALEDIRTPAASIRATAEALYRSPFADTFPGRQPCNESGRSSDLADALALATVFQSFHRRRLNAVHRPPAWRAALPGSEDPASYLARVRDGALRQQQAAAASMVRWAQRACALLFFGAVASYEAFTELIPAFLLPLLAYLGLLVTIWLIAAVVKLRRIQLRAEDYRGLREMMRVQIAWWSSGIERHVDRVHLRTIESDLRLVREAAAAICAWAVLRCTRLPDRDIRQLPLAGGRPGAGTAATVAEQWITSQAKYFHEKSRAQFSSKRLDDLAFGLALGSALAVLPLLAVAIWLHTHGVTKGQLGPWILRARDAAALAVPLLAGALCLGFLRVIRSAQDGDRNPAASRVRRPRQTRIGAPMQVLEWIAGAVLVASFCATLARFAGHLWPDLAARLPRLALVRSPALATAGYLGALLVLLASRAGPRMETLALREPRRWLRWAAVVPVVLLVLSCAVVFAPSLAALDAASEPPIAERFRSLVLSQAVLLLAAAGMMNWYSERRNHLAQAAHYDDMLRVFRRAEGWLRDAGAIDDRARERLIELGELALDENEAWLKAHRERPVEPMA